MLAAYGSAFSPPAGVDLIACNDNGDGLGAQSRLELQLTQGVQYYFQVGGAAGAGGGVVLNIAADPPGGSISGTVTDGNGDPISNAFVRAEFSYAYTATDGAYTLLDLQPGYTAYPPRRLVT